MNDKKIMVVDDEKSIRDTFARIFRQKGFAVQTAASAQEALQAMRSQQAEVLFLDLNLPDSSGLELCREIRKHWPWTIAIAVTGYASVFELVDCREAGFEDYFIKPASLDDLLQAAVSAFKKIERWRAR